MKSAKVVDLFAHLRPTQRNRDQLSFLPAALEIVETPPSPVGRTVGLVIILVFTAALAWAALGTVDIVASAQGRIVPSDRVKVIQPLEIGVVRGLYVEDGKQVKAGDVLLEIDPTINEAEGRMLKHDLIATQLDIARLRAALSTDEDPLKAFTPPAGAPEKLVVQQQRFLESQVAEHRAKLAALEKQRQQKEAEAGTIAATVAKLEAVIPVIQQRFEIRNKLHSQELGSKLQYLEMLQVLTEQKQELLVQKSNLKVAEAAAAALGETRNQVVAEWRRGLFDELGKLTQKENGLSENLVKAEQRTKLQQLRAPVDGTVQQLAVFTVGGVVTPSQELMVIVPKDSRLEVEAMISNRDIGFVQTGQQVELKIDTFNFTKYGLIDGHVVSVSSDAIRRAKPVDKSKEKGAAADSTNSEPAGQELMYAARIALDRTDMQIEDKKVNLAPGMAVTAEIKTGSRSILSYLLSPIMRFKSESLRER
jgi:hemolysin D